MWQKVWKYHEVNIQSLHCFYFPIVKSFLLSGPKKSIVASKTFIKSNAILQTIYSYFITKKEKKTSAKNCFWHQNNKVPSRNKLFYICPPSKVQTLMWGSFWMQTSKYQIPCYSISVVQIFLSAVHLFKVFPFRDNLVYK